MMGRAGLPHWFYAGFCSDHLGGVVADGSLGFPSWGATSSRDWINTPIFKILSAKICSIKEGNSPDSLNPNKIKRGKFFFRRQFGKILRSSCM